MRLAARRGKRAAVMYRAEGSSIFYVHPDDHTEELFITVHPTTSSISVEEQALRLVELLMELPVVDLNGRKVSSV